MQTMEELTDDQRGRSPHGECGLKFALGIGVAIAQLVAPRTGSVD